MTAVSSETDQRARSFDLFASLWAWFSLFHQANTGTWAGDALDVTMTFAAVAVVANPRRLDTFLFLLLAQNATFWAHAPDLVNHAIFAVIANLTILTGVVWLAAKKWGRPVDRGELYGAVAPVLRVEVVILYFWATMHKINVDFFLVEWSAAVVHLENLSNQFQKLGFPALPMITPVKLLTVYSTVVIESGIPLLLAFRRTRTWGIWLGLIFHYILAIEDFYDFSAMAYAVLILFMPDNTPELLGDWWRRTGLDDRARALRARPLFQVVTPTLLVGSAVLLFVSFFDLYSGRASDRLGKVAFLLFGAGYIAAWYGAIHGKGARAYRYGDRMFRFPAWGFALFPLLVFVNGLAPHIGLKTRSAFAMFSNLRTEGERTNHLLLPAGMQVFGLQKHMVLCTESSHSPFREFAAEQTWIPAWELRARLSQLVAEGAKDVRIAWLQRADQPVPEGARTSPADPATWARSFGVERPLVRVEVDRAETLAEISRPHAYLSRKLLLFGGVGPTIHQPNRH